MILHSYAPAFGFSYGEKTVSGADLWIEYEVLFTSFPTGSSSGDISAFKGIGLEEGVFIYLDGGQYKFWTFWANNGPFQAVSLSTWYLVDQRYSPGFPGLSELWVDGVDQGVVATTGLSDAITAIDVGLYAADGSENVFLRNLKVGTSRGASDVWSTDFSGSLATIFTSTVVDPGNTLEIVSVLVPTTSMYWRARS